MLATFVAAAVAVAGLVVAAQGASADSGSSLVAMINSARAAHGLPALAVSGDLTTAARAQAGRMAASRTLAHTPNLGGAVCCWTTVGENVGEGPSASSIESAFMGSAEHRANILSSAYTQVGIGAVVDNAGTLWVSEIFRRPSGAAAPAPAPEPTPKATPQPTKPVVKQPAPKPTATHRAVTAKPPVAAPTTATVPTRASRDLARVPIDAARRLAEQLDGARGVQGFDPVTRLLDFVALNATLAN